MRILLAVPAFAKIYGSYRRFYKKAFNNPPLSLCYIAAAAEKAGHTVKILDGEAHNLSIDQILNQAKDFEPDLFGITATSIDYHVAEQLIKSFKNTFPRIPVLLGGTHVNIFEKEVLQDNPAIDLGCIGDGEDLIQELLEVMSKGDSKVLENVPGLIFRRNGEIIQNPYRPLEKDIDRYTFPALHLLDNSLYFRAFPYDGYQVTASFMSSRGCPYRCVFCAVDKLKMSGGSTVRLRTAENVLDELEVIVNKMGIKYVAFNDDCFTVNKKRVHEICEGIQKRGLKFTWEAITRADRVDKELLIAMKEAGLTRVSYGIESGNTTILKAINKAETLERIEEAFKITQEVGIVTRGTFMIGNPFETRKTIKDTFRYMRKLQGLDQVILSIMQPYPGTKVRDMALNGEGGLKFLENKNDFGILQKFGSASISVNELSPKDLIFLQKWGLLSFYLRPLKLLRNIKITGTKVFLSDGYNFVRSVIGI